MPLKKDRLTALLSLGYFPKELPPVFTTIDFGQHSKEIIDEWRLKSVFSTEPCKAKSTGKGNKKLSGSYIYRLKDAEVEIISIPKKGYERRNLHVTHPVPQSLLAYEISSNWKSIELWLLRQTNSLDKIQISNDHVRSIKGINFKAHSAKKGFIEATSDWLVKTDITRFYPSIYTHSISWAAYGKKRVKNNLSVYKGSLADRLDILIRSCNRNQTIGIPIGPETSRIIAEVISSRIDDDFRTVNHDISLNKVDRLQDDWFIGADTLDHAENALSAITNIYREYGLEINGSKTSINRILALSGTSGISELASFLSHGGSSLKGSRLKEFLLLSLRIQAAHPNESVIKYAVSVIEGQYFSDDDIEPIESYLLKAAVMSPISLDNICRIFINIDNKTNKISKERVVDRFRILAERNLEKCNIFESIWLIYTIRGLKQKLKSKKISELIGSHAGSTLPLILLDMKQQGLFPQKLPNEHWEGMIDDQRVRSDWIWLLAYEGIRKRWLSDRKGVLKRPFFKAMHDRNVVFYDPRKNVDRSTKVIREKRATSKQQNFEVLAFLRNIRGFDLFDDHEEY